jgi:tetratricopeptide (TPR) repeat protein
MLLPLVLSLGLAGQVPVPASADLARAYELFLEGRDLSEDGQLAAAIAKLRESFRVVASAEVLVDIAGLHAQLGNMTEAEAEIERALAIDAKSASAHRLAGLLVDARLGRATGSERRALAQKGVSHLEIAMAASGRDPALMLALGELYLAAGNHARAIYILQQFLIDRPGYPQATMLLVQAYRESGQTDEAQAVIDGFDRSTAETPAGLARTAAGFEARREWASAAATWARVLEQNPSDPQARLRYAAALLNGGQTQRGRDELVSLSRENPDDVLVLSLLSEAELGAGRPDAAEAAARRIMTIDPADPRGMLSLADVRQARGDHQGVIALLAERLARPTSADLSGGVYREAARRTSAAYLALGNAKAATSTLEGARERAPSDLDLLFSLAATYEQAGAIGKAEQAFRDVIALEPDHAPALNYLGYMLADRGRKLPEAVSLIERALALDADNASYLDSLGWAYFKQRRYAQAIDPLERAAKGAPSSSVILDHLGDAYLKVNRYTDAAAAFDRALAGDRDGIDQESISKKRDQARAAAGRR